MSTKWLDAREESSMMASSPVGHPPSGTRLSRRQWLAGVTALGATARVQLPSRSDGGYRSEYLPNGVQNEMKKLYFDIVRVADPESFALLTALMPPERLPFGSDDSAVSISETASHPPALHLDGKVLRRIERDNALALFPRFKA